MDYNFTEVDFAAEKFVSDPKQILGRLTFQEDAGPDTCMAEEIAADSQ